jgi:hypothetical protein
VIDYKKGPGLREHPSELLTAVIFGMHTSDDDKKRVTEWLKRRDHPIELLQAKQQDNSYQLELSPI